MKAIKLLALGGILVHAVGAQASTIKDYDADALHLLSSVHTNCPIQFIQAMHGANRVGQARYLSDRIGETFEITTVGGGYAPSFQTWEVAKLTIRRKPIREKGPIAYDKPTRWDVSCEVSKP